MREHASESRDYEMMVVVAPTVAEDGLPAVAERVSGYIANQGGSVQSVSHENPWGRRRLAYPIQDHRDAFYVLYRFLADAESITELEREIKLDEQIIRYLVVRYDELAEHQERPPRGQQPGGPVAAEQQTEASEQEPAQSASTNDGEENDSDAAESDES